MQRLAALVVSELVLLSVGSLCLFWPRRVQEFALAHLVWYNPFARFMKSQAYVWMLRLMGVMMLGCFFLVALGFNYRTD